jgi:hypothetical protein
MLKEIRERRDKILRQKDELKPLPLIEKVVELEKDAY